VAPRPSKFTAYYQFCSTRLAMSKRPKAIAGG
jgi:hypothetical protein